MKNFWNMSAMNFENLNNQWFRVKYSHQFGHVSENGGKQSFLFFKANFAKRKMKHLYFLLFRAF